jgi:hypothetical protein
MKSKNVRIGGLLMGPVCIMGLSSHLPFMWIVCPQALAVMFLRQWQHGYDSLGSAGIPDLVVASLYYPLIAWILSRASQEGRLRSVAIHVAIWHIAVIGFAVFAGAMRNRIWGIT